MRKTSMVVVILSIILASRSHAQSKRPASSSIADPQSDAQQAAKLGKIGVEFLSGSLFALVGMVVGDNIGHSLPIAHPFGTGDDVASLGEILGIQVGSALGGFSGVYMTGQALGDHGQALATLMGSGLGSSTALLLTFSVDGTWGTYILSNILLSAAGATIGFNLTEEEGEETALMNITGGQIHLAVPPVSFRPDCFHGMALTPRVNLMKVRF